jgi:ribonuclease E
LPFKEVTRSYFKEGVDVGRARIQDALREGQEIIVQVEKDERGTKGAALTTFISLAGRYLVLMPNNPRGGGVSRRVEGEERNELRDTLDQLQLPDGMSVIARTAAIGRSPIAHRHELPDALGRSGARRTSRRSPSSSTSSRAW